LRAEVCSASEVVIAVDTSAKGNQASSACCPTGNELVDRGSAWCVRDMVALAFFLERQALLKNLWRMARQDEREFGY
jgi:hypothetical protein